MSKTSALEEFLAVLEEGTPLKRSRKYMKLCQKAVEATAKNRNLAPEKIEEWAKHLASQTAHLND